MIRPGPRPALLAACRSAALAAFGGPAGRRAAARGLLTVGVSSAVVNVGVKSLYPRQRLIR